MHYNIIHITTEKAHMDIKESHIRYHKINITQFIFFIITLISPEIVTIITQNLLIPTVQSV